MKISIIVAMADDRVIGHGGGLPWQLSADLKRFKRLTMGHWIMMGRKTFESIGRSLPGRTSVVITRRPDYRRDGALVASSLEDALRMAAGQAEVFVIGGARIFRQALPLADRLYLTRVHAKVPGDTFFPEFDARRWRLLQQTRHPADEKNAHAYSFQLFESTIARAETA